MAINLILDTNAYTHLIAQHPGVVKLVRNADSLLFSAIVVGELEYGFQAGNRYAKNSELLNRYLTRPQTQFLPITHTTTQIYGELRAAMRRNGKPIPTNDCWIAAHAIEHRAPLVSFDKHFHTIANLQLIIPE